MPSDPHPSTANQFAMADDHSVPTARAALEDLEAELRQHQQNLALAEQMAVEARCRLGDTWLRKGHLLQRLGEEPAAFEALLNAHRLGHSNPDGLAFLSSHLLRASEQTPQAQAIYHEHLALPANDSERLVRQHEFLAMVAQSPAMPGILTALEVIPARDRDNLYWAVRGNELLAAGQLEGALAAWSEIAPPTPSLLAAQAAVARRWFAEAHNNHDDDRILTVVRRGLIRHVTDEVVVQIVANALTRQVHDLQAALPGTGTDWHELFDEVISCLPVVADSAAVISLQRHRHARASEQLRQVLEDQAAAAGLADPAACHNLALFYLAESNRCAEAGDPDSALSYAEQAIAHLAVALTDDNYLRHFCQRRSAGYETTLTAEDQVSLKPQVAQHCESYFGWLADRLRASDQPQLAQQAADLTLTLQAELRAARLVYNLGGLPVPGRIARTIAAGPAYVRLMDLEEAFAAFVATLKVKGRLHPSSADAAASVASILDFDDEPEAGTIDAELKAELEQLFSPAVLRGSTNARGPADGSARARARRRAQMPGRAGALAPFSHGNGNGITADVGGAADRLGESGGADPRNRVRSRGLDLGAGDLSERRSGREAAQSGVGPL